MWRRFFWLDKNMRKKVDIITEQVPRRRRFCRGGFRQQRKASWEVSAFWQGDDVADHLCFRSCFVVLAYFRKYIPEIWGFWYGPSLLPVEQLEKKISHSSSLRQLKFNLLMWTNIKIHTYTCTKSKFECNILPGSLLLISSIAFAVCSAIRSLVGRRVSG
jgi:hypothetical protein